MIVIKFCIHNLRDLIAHNFFGERMRESLELLSEIEQEEVFENMESYFDEVTLEELKEYLSGELNRRLPFGF
jgi:hypothetical protein